MCELKNRHWSAFVANKKQDEGWMCCSRWVTKGDAYHYLMINTQVWFHTTCEFTFSFPFSLLLLFFFFLTRKKRNDRICSLFAWNDLYLCLPDKDLLWLYKLWQMLLRSNSRSSVRRCYSSPRRIKEDVGGAAGERTIWHRRPLFAFRSCFCET